MRIKLLLLPIFLFLFTANSFSQDYINTSTEWNIYERCIKAQIHETYSNIHVIDEVSINDTSYYHLERVLYDSIFWPGDIITLDTFILDFGYIREQDKRFFYKWEVEAEEVLLYDFNLEIGDTIPEDFFGENYLFDGPVIIVNIDLITEGNLSRKCFHTNYSNIQIIEGVCSNLEDV